RHREMVVTRFIEGLPNAICPTRGDEALRAVPARQSQRRLDAAYGVAFGTGFLSSLLGMNLLARYTPLLRPISCRKLVGISGIWKLSITCIETNTAISTVKKSICSRVTSISPSDAIRSRQLGAATLSVGASGSDRSAALPSLICD